MDSERVTPVECCALLLGNNLYECLTTPHRNPYEKSPFMGILAVKRFSQLRVVTRIAWRGFPGGKTIKSFRFRVHQL
jgi:hypothetical protein